MLFSSIKHQWDNDLVRLYGEVKAQVEKQLTRAEAWQKKHDKNPVLLMTLGGLAMATDDLTKAKEYLEASIEIQASKSAYQLLGQLYEQNKDSKEAFLCYRQALDLT